LASSLAIKKSGAGPAAAFVARSAPLLAFLRAKVALVLPLRRSCALLRVLGRDEDEEDEDEGADDEAVTKFRYRLREDDDAVDDTDGTVLAVGAAETIIVVMFSCKCVPGACVSLSGSLRALLNARALCLLFFWRV